jgi:hypothetical protein
MAEYVLDKDSQVKFEKVLNTKTYNFLKISEDGIKLLLKFYNNNVHKKIPEALLSEYIGSDHANYRSLSSGIALLIVDKSGDDYEFSFGKEKNRNCKDFEIVSKGKVHIPEIEGITYCLKNDKIFITDDKAARYLCSCMGVEFISSKDFIKKSGIDKYLIN